MPSSANENKISRLCVAVARFSQLSPPSTFSSPPSPLAPPSPRLIQMIRKTLNRMSSWFSYETQTPPRPFVVASYLYPSHADGAKTNSEQNIVVVFKTKRIRRRREPVRRKLPVPHVRKGSRLGRWVGHATSRGRSQLRRQPGVALRRSRRRQRRRDGRPRVAISSKVRDEYDKGYLQDLGRDLCSIS